MGTKDIALILSFTDKGTPVVRRVVKGVTRELTKLEKKALSAGRGFKKFEKDVQNSTKGMSKFKKVMKSAAMQTAAGIGTMMGAQSVIRGLTRAVSDFVKTGREFEKEWANVTTMLSISEGETLKLKRQLIDLSPHLGSTTEMAKAMYQVLSASVDPAEAIEFLGAAAKAAAAGVTDAFTAVDALTTVINAYGMAAEDVTAVSDIMFQTVKRGKLTFGELASALGTVVPTAAQLGIRFEEIAAGMATLTRQGINVNTVTMQLRQVMMSVLKPTSEALVLAEKLGIEFSAAGLKAKGMSGFLADLTEKTGGNVEIMGEFFGNIRALSAVFGLAGKSAADFAYDITLMEEATGSTEEAFKKQMKSLNFWIETTSNALEKMKIAFYEGLVGPVRDVITSQEELDKVFETLTNSARMFGEVLGTVGYFFKIVQPLTTQFLESVAVLDDLFAKSVQTMSLGLLPMYSDMIQEEHEARVKADRLAEAEKKLAKNFGGVWGQIAQGAEWWKRQVDFYINSGMAVEDYLKALNKLRKGQQDYQKDMQKLQAIEDLNLKTKSVLRNELATLTKNIEEAAVSGLVYTDSLETHIKKAIRLAEVTGKALSPAVRGLAVELGLLEDRMLAVLPAIDGVRTGTEWWNRSTVSASIVMQGAQSTMVGYDYILGQVNMKLREGSKLFEKYALAPLPKPDPDAFTLWFEKLQATARDTAAVFLTVTSGLDAIANQYYQNQMQRIDNEYQKRKTAIDESMTSDQEKYFAIEKLDREMDKKRLAAKKKQAIATKLTGIMEATIHTAVAVADALPDIPLSIIVGGLGAAQIALVAAQPLPAFAEGGIAGLHGPEAIIVGEKGPERITPIGKEGVAANVEFNANFIISSPDALGVRDFVRDRAGPEFIEWVRLNKTDLLEALELV